MKKIQSQIILTALLVFWCFGTAQAQTDVFTYQGRLTDSMGLGGSGSYLMKFELYSDAAGSLLVDTLDNIPVTVANNVFSVQLNFTAANAFDGTGRYLKISIKRTTGDVYTALNPLQPITSVPYSIRSLKAATADISTNTLSVDGTPAAQIIKEGDVRLTDTRTPTAGSADYVQNTTTQQTSTNFNVSGTGTANVFNAATQYNISGERVFSTPGFSNTFAGNYAGANNPGNSNSFFGSGAGYSNLSGAENSFFGRGSGSSNTSGSYNSFFGLQAGLDNTTGNDNSFFGVQAGIGNTTGSNNTLIGSNANVGANNLIFATALGSGAVVSTSNTIAFGRNDGSDKVIIYGLGTADNMTFLCRNSLNQIANCSVPSPFNNSGDTDAMKTRIEAQQKQLDELKKIVCLLKPDAAVCQ